RKFFLTASLDERARRRHAEFAARGEPIAWDAVRRDLEERDARDAARAIAPMKPAADALIIDTTGVSLDQVVASIEQDIRDHLAVASASLSEVESQVLDPTGGERFERSNDA